MKLRGCLLTAALLPRCLLAGQAPKDAAAHDPATTFNVRSNLVLVRVVVRDRAGHADGHLQKEDFQVFDKGKPQSISQFSMEGTAGRQAEAARSPNVGENPPDPKSPPDHYVAYVFDDLHLSFGDLARAREAAERHMAESLRSTGRAAIFTSSGQIALDFTNDAAKLQEALRRLQPRALAAPSSTDCPNVTYYEADLIRNKNDAGALGAATLDTLRCARLPPEMEDMARSMVEAAASRLVSTGDIEARLALGVLRDTIARMSELDGLRGIVLVSPGFLLFQQRVDEVETMDRAIRANITISALDARGLFTLIPGGDASQPNGNPAALRARTKYQKEAALSQEDVMAELADGTGGTFIHNSNDLEGGLRRIAVAPEYYYILGFSPQNLKFDGSYHTVKVSLAKRFDGYTVQARRGYFAPRQKVSSIRMSEEQMAATIAALGKP